MVKLLTGLIILLAFFFPQNSGPPRQANSW
jgi:hypothetical protein